MKNICIVKFKICLINKINYNNYFNFRNIMTSNISLSSPRTPTPNGGPPRSSTPKSMTMKERVLDDSQNVPRLPPRTDLNNR